MDCITRIVRNEEAATAVEYAVMLALVFSAVLAGIGLVGSQTNGMFGTAKDQLEAAGVGAS